MSWHLKLTKILSFIFTLIAFQAMGQESIVLDIQYLGDKESQKTVSPSEHLEIKAHMIKSTLSGRLQTLYEQAYLAAWYEFKISGINVTATFYTGGRFELARLSKGNLEETLLNKVGYTERFYRNKPFSYKEISGLMHRIISWAENNGYPFAAVQMDSIAIEGKQISATLNFDAGPLIVFDSIAITGMKDLKYKFLMSHLGIYKKSFTGRI